MHEKLKFSFQYFNKVRFSRHYNFKSIVLKSENFLEFILEVPNLCDILKIKKILCFPPPPPWIINLYIYIHNNEISNEILNICFFFIKNKTKSYLSEYNSNNLAHLCDRLEIWSLCNHIMTDGKYNICIFLI